MGKGDRKSRRGKIWRGTFGKNRPRKKAVAVNNPQPVKPEKESKKKTTETSE